MLGDFEGKFCVVRTKYAGVHVGIVAHRDPSTMELLFKRSRIIHSWEGPKTLYEVSTGGVGEGSNLSDWGEGTVVAEVIQIHPATEKARKNLEDYPA